MGKPRGRSFGRLHAQQEDVDAAHRAYQAARVLIDRVKTAVREPQLRAGLEHAPAIREIYALADSPNDAT